MSLTIQKEELEQRQLSMTIEVDEERVQNEMRRVARTLSRQVRIPGFRPGKAPLPVILKRFGEEAVRAQAVEEMMQKVLVEALEQAEVEPFARPTLEDMDLEPAVVLKLTVPLAPEVKLGDYRQARRDIDAVEISDEAVDEAVERMRDSRATTEDIDRPAEKGDLIKLAGHGHIVPLTDDAADDEDKEEASSPEDDPNANNEIFHSHDGVEFVLDPETTFAGTGFVDELLGLTVGDTKTFTITYPGDYEVSDFAGRQAEFDVEVLNLQSRQVPEIDEAFLEESGHESLEALRAKLREDLHKQAENELQSQVLEEWIDELMKEATLVYPPAAIEEELEETLDNLKKQVGSYGWEWNDYMQSQQVTESDLKEQWREDAVRNFERSLVLREFIQTERLKVDEAELDGRLEERLTQFGEMEDSVRDAMRRVFLSPDGMQRMANDIMVEKAFERIRAILAGAAPNLEALAAEEEKAAEDDTVEAASSAALAEAPAEDAEEAEAAVEADEPTDATTLPESEAAGSA